MPEARIFISPRGAQDLAIKAGFQDLLIGFGNTSGVSGDFELAAIDQGHGGLVLNARFFEPATRPVASNGCQRPPPACR